MAVLIIVKSQKSGESLLHEQSLGDSRFVIDKGKVYVLKPGDGYFELEAADINTFEPMVFENEYGTFIGKDASHVFAADTRIVNADVHTAQYLGRSYVKDAENVYYRTLKIPGADLSSFQSLKHSAGFNTPRFSFAKDKNHVFYRDTIIKYADPNTISSVDETLDYLKDSRHAFYRTQLLTGINVQNFHAVKINYQIYLATDGKKYFVNNKQFPAVVSNTLWGKTEVDTTNLSILQKPTSNQRHLLFSDGKSIYYYDDAKAEFICAAHMAGIKPLGGNGFTDGTFYYMTTTINLATRKYGSLGSQTNIYKTDIKVKDLQIVYQFEAATVFKVKSTTAFTTNQINANNDYYISIDDAATSLYKIKDFSQFDREIIQAHRTYVSHGETTYFEKITNKKLVLKVKTRRRTHFEDENQ